MDFIIGTKTDSISSVQAENGQNKKFISWIEFEQYMEELATTLIKKTNIDYYKNIYGLPRGGLIVAVWLSHRLNKPLILSESDIEKDTLIVDDIADSGETMFALLTRVKKVTRPTIVCIVHKEHTSFIKPEFAAITTRSDDWIVFPWEVK